MSDDQRHTQLPHFSTEDLTERDAVVSALHRAGYFGHDGGSGMGSWDAHLGGPGLILAISGGDREALPYIACAVREDGDAEHNGDPEPIASIQTSTDSELLLLAAALIQEKNRGAPLQLTNQPGEVLNEQGGLVSALSGLGYASKTVYSVNTETVTLESPAYTLDLEHTPDEELPYGFQAARRGGEDRVTVRCRAATSAVLLRLAAALLPSQA